MQLNISKNVQIDLEGYYITKKYHGKVFEERVIRAMFGVRRTYGMIRKFIEWQPYQPRKNKGGFKIRKCYLVRRDRALAHFDKEKSKFGHNSLYVIQNMHITGTNLYMFDERMPFWKYPEYRPEVDWLPTEIEEHHINEDLKNRDQVLEFLKVVKAKYKEG